MKIRPLLKAFVLVVATGLVLPACGGGGEPPLHVFVFLVDTVRSDALGCYGGKAGATPRIDALAAEGVRFDQAISASGWTLPSVATILTGTWPRIHGASGKNVTLTPVRDEIPTAAEVMSDAGFTTLGFANAAFVSPMLKLDRGFDHFDHRYTYNWNARAADETIDAAIERVEKHRGDPSFVLVHLFDPHLTYDPPDGWAERFTGGRTTPETPLTMDLCEQLAERGGGIPAASDRKYIRDVYHAEVAFMDSEIGRFVDRLRELGLYDRSMIVLVADHGEEFWDHGGFEHGHTLYDELIRVPMIVKFPADVETSRAVVTEQVRTLDLMPTVFEVAGVEAPETFLGRSILPLARGEADGERPAFAEGTLYGADRLCFRKDGFKFLVDMNPKAKVRRELYAVEKDPAESENLIRNESAVAKEMDADFQVFLKGVLASTAKLSRPAPVDLSPQRIEMLRELGYVR